MINQMKAILKANAMGVLATSSDTVPHCSLMAYITNDEGDRLFFVTLKETRKYRTIRQNPCVSFLVDTRMSHKDRQAIQALTVSGKCAPVTDMNTASRLLVEMAQQHPHLNEIMHHPDVAVLEFRIESMQLLKGPVEQHVQQLNPSIDSLQETHDAMDIARRVIHD